MRRTIGVFSVLIIALLYFGASYSMASDYSYTVKTGDSLWGIAQKNGLSVEEIKRINNLESDFLNVGDILYLQDRIVQADTSNDNTVYYVKAGDNLWKIAGENNISVARLKEINGMNSDFLKIGQKLLLEAQAAGQTVAETEESANDSRATEAENLYVVQAGDSLWAIANQYGMNLDRLKYINNLSSELVNPGKKLNIEPGTPSRGSEFDTNPNAVLEKAAQYLGTPYSYGGQSPQGFDCSGFVKYVYSSFGYNLPRTAASQYQSGISVDKANLMAGDLVFFKCYSSGIDHVGIYCGNNKFIHSSSPRSGGVIYSSLGESYYAKSYTGARRILR